MTLTDAFKFVSAVSKVEHWLEGLHDRRKEIELIWQSRKTQVEQCLALALLATELLDVENMLKTRKDYLLKNSDLGDSKMTAKILLEELMKISAEAKVRKKKLLLICHDRRDETRMIGRKNNFFFFFSVGPSRQDFKNYKFNRKTSVDGAFCRRAGHLSVVRHIERVCRVLN